MNCYCKEEPIEMELVDCVNDYHEPSDYHGHGQTEYKVWECGECGNTEDYNNSPY